MLAPEVRFLVDRLSLEARDRHGRGGHGDLRLRPLPHGGYGSTALTPFDRELFDVGRHLRSDFAVDVAKAVTELGSFTSVTALLVVAVVVLVARNRPVDAALLVLGFALIYLAVDVTKDAVDRVRPAGPAGGHERVGLPERPRRVRHHLDRGCRGAHPRARPSEPGGDHHRRDRPDRGAIGLSRVYLRAHYWSDVAGGWALGAGIYGLVATIALIVEQVRNNDRSTAPTPS